MLAPVARRPLFTLIGAIALVVAIASPAAATPGDLDPTFDGDGKVTTDFERGVDLANGVVIQADGKIVVAGLASVSVLQPGDFGLARYNTDGSLDPTFDGDGKVTTDFATQADQAFAMAIQGDGKIVAAGRARVAGIFDFALARYNTDGSLDLTFGVLGKVITDFSDSSDQAFAVAIQGDGKIVAAGSTTVPGNIIDFALARYNADGSLDPTFDGDGMVTTDFEADFDEAFGVTLQGDGKIVAAGGANVSETHIDFALARYNGNGALDPTFDGDGKVTTDFAADPDEARAVTLQGDGKIVAAGSAFVSENDDFALVRYNADGSLDPTFDGDGKVNTDFAGMDDVAFAEAIQPNGRIVAAGGATISGTEDFAVARYKTDGSLDTIFSGDGRVTTDFAGMDDAAFAAAIQPNGMIVAAGGTRISGPTIGGNIDFALARYESQGFADLSLAKAGPSGRVPTGRNMTYMLTVANHGPDDASDVTVLDQLPPSVSFVSAAPSQGSCGESAGSVTCALGSLAYGATATVDIVVRPTTAGTITNIASVSAFEVDPNTTNNTDSVDTSACRITSRRSSIPCG
ncbi:MAG TPA: calcium-binding protein [Actinomycetota bacterium]|nr:calcium-binding protein [Actinomycetota bacterium]